MKATPIIMVVIAVLMVSTAFIPAVQASNGVSRSGEVVEVNEIVSMLPGTDYDFTSLLNIANDTDQWLNNYNQTIKPFMNDNPTIKGIMVYPYFAPLLVNATFDDRDISVGGFIRMEPNTIMDGVSEFWIRVPVFNLNENVTIAFRMWRVLDPINFNATMTGVGTTEFTTSQLQLVCDVEYDKNADVLLTKADPIPNGYLGSVLHHSSDHDFWANQWWNTTWVNVVSAIFPNENYYMQFDLTWPVGEKEGEIQLAISQEDFCADNRYNSWFYVNGTGHFLQADFDMSMIMTYGLSNGITGLGTSTYNIGEPVGSPGTVYYNLNSSIPFREEVTMDYFELVIPLLWDENELPALSEYTNVTFKVSLYSSEDDSVCFATDVFYKNINATYSYVVHDMDITAYDGEYLDHARVHYRVNQFYATTFKLWAYQYPGENITSVPGYSDSYISVENSTNIWYHIYNKAFFIPYGYYGQSDSYWNQTQYNLVVIPISTPDTPNEIVEAIHRFQMYVEDQDGNGKLITVEDIGKLLWEALKFAVTKYIDAVITIVSIVLRAVIDFFFGEGTADWLWNTIISIGQWIHDSVLFLIDAFEWFVYWAVRTVYSISVVIVYLLNVFGVISINSALLAYAKTGKSRDFVKAFRSGWNFVWAIISFLISGLILAVSIIGAVVPF